MYSPGRIFYMVVDVKKQQKLFRNSSITAAPRHLPFPFGKKTGYKKSRGN